MVFDDILRATKKSFLLEVGKTDKQNFRVEISAIQLPCKVNTKKAISVSHTFDIYTCGSWEKELLYKVIQKWSTNETTTNVCDTEGNNYVYGNVRQQPLPHSLSSFTDRPLETRSNCSQVWFLHYVLPSMKS